MRGSKVSNPKKIVVATLTGSTKNGCADKAARCMIKVSIEGVGN